MKLEKIKESAIKIVEKENPYSSYQTIQSFPDNKLNIHTKISENKSTFPLTGDEFLSEKTRSCYFTRTGLPSS